MGDVTIVWNQTEGDWALAGADLLTGDDLETAVLISLFSDRVAAPDDVIPDGSTDPRGWWGDEDDDYPIGSKLWLLSRAKQSDQTLASASSYVKDALQWLIDDGVVASIDVSAAWVSLGTLEVEVDLNQTDGTKTSYAFQALWAQLAN